MCAIVIGLWLVLTETKKQCTIEPYFLNTRKACMMKTKMPVKVVTLSVFLILFLAVFVQQSIPQQMRIQSRTSFSQTMDTLIDVFPLVRGLHYKYDYYNEKSYAEVATLFQLWTDSGSVEYLIHDSTLTNDTTITWNVEERRILKHRRYDWVPGEDTIYYTNDTAAMTLQEITIGKHEFTAQGLVWSFPTASLYYSNTMPIYRYSEVSTAIATQYFRVYTGEARDSLYFSNDQGFYRRHQSYSYGQNDHWFALLEANLQSVSVDAIHEQKLLPNIIELSQNYPNPFNPTTIITFSVGTYGNTSLKVYDVLGREVAILVNEAKNAGNYKVIFNASKLASGVYFYKLTAGGYSFVKKLLLMK
jgi:hypothetical protein